MQGTWLNFINSSKILLFLTYYRGIVLKTVKMFEAIFLVYRPLACNKKLVPDGDTKLGTLIQPEFERKIDNFNNVSNRGNQAADVMQQNKFALLILSFFKVSLSFCDHQLKYTTDAAFAEARN